MFDDKLPMLIEVITDKIDFKIKKGKYNYDILFDETNGLYRVYINESFYNIIFDAIPANVVWTYLMMFSEMSEIGENETMIISEENHATILQTLNVR